MIWACSLSFAAASNLIVQMVFTRVYGKIKNIPKIRNDDLDMHTSLANLG